MDVTDVQYKVARIRLVLDRVQSYADANTAMNLRFYKRREFLTCYKERKLCSMELIISSIKCLGTPFY
jgi:hypothetical protein